jgi:hypothetical protein
MTEVSDAITTAARYIMKRTLLKVKECGFDPKIGDTDSSYLQDISGQYTIEQMNIIFYKFYDEFYDNIKYLYKSLPKITRDKVKIEEFMFFCYICS